MKRAALLLLVITFSAGCGKRIELSSQAETEPEIFPDYKDITVPCNIAPLNFNYLGDEDACLLVENGSESVCLKARKGLFSFKTSQWRKLTRGGGVLKLTIAIKRGNDWQGLKPFSITVSDDSIDSYLCYRLIPPGYQAWMKMGLYQRCLETYSQTPVFENKLADRNCVNCHSFPQGDPSKMLFHSRAVFGGTIMAIDGKVEKLNTQTDSTISALVYPFWHPSGKYVAFSVNKTNQCFFNHDPNRIEVYDSGSDVVVYDVENHEITYSELTKSPDAFETFPSFSPDGRSLYFCSAAAVDSMPQKYDKVKYSLCRIGFNPEDGSFGSEVDTLLNARMSGKSVSFPRVSPDGRFLVFTFHGYGNFSIWHKDADLWAVDLQNGKSFPLDKANSEDVESYHSWSRNGRWLVFSSRRGDGLYTRPFIVHIDENGEAAKPFLLPQKNPLKFYQDLMDSFNIPELTTGEVKVGQRKLSRTLRNSKGTDVGVNSSRTRFLQ